MLQLTKNGLELNGNPDALRDHFSAKHYVVLNALLEPTLLKSIQQHLERSQWRSSTYEHGFSGTEFTLDDPVTGQLLGFLLNNPEFLSVIRVISGCTMIRNSVAEFIAWLPARNITYPGIMTWSMRRGGR